MGNKYQTHAIWLCQQPGAALPLHLPSDKRTGKSTPDPILRWRQQPSWSYYSAFLQGRSASWECLSWHAARSGQWQHSMRWTFGRGATAGVAPKWCPLQRLKESGASVSARAGSGQLRRGSGTANRPGLGLLAAAAQNEQTVYDIFQWTEPSKGEPSVSPHREGAGYDIIYDINVCSCMISYPTQVLWYHDMNAMISYTKSYNIKCTWNIYDIITKGMISYMITGMISSFSVIWYWVYLWYHTCSYDIIYNIIYMIWCMILQYDILRDRIHHIANDITYKIIWYYVYFKIPWYHKKMYDIIYHIEYDIDFSYHMIFINLKISMIS